MSEVTLRECPFCGEMCAEMHISPGDKWAQFIPSCLEVRTGYDISDDATWHKEAIALWNTRAQSTTQQKLDLAVEALKAIERVIPIETPDKLGLEMTRIAAITLEALANIKDK